MAIVVSWYNEQHSIIKVTFQNEWTLEEYVDAFAQSAELSRSSDVIVSVIIDATQSTGVPRNANLIPHFRNALYNDLYDYIVFAGGSSFGLTLVKMLIGIVPNGRNRILFASNVDDAAERVLQLRAKAN